MAFAGSSHSAHTHHWITRRLCQSDGDYGHIIIIICCICVCVWVVGSIEGCPYACGQKMPLQAAVGSLCH